MCSTAVRKYGEAILFVPDEMQTLELCRIAVRDDGENIQYVPNEHIHELYDDAVRNYPGAFTMIPTHMQTAELYIRAVQLCGMYSERHEQGRPRFGRSQAARQGRTHVYGRRQAV